MKYTEALVWLGRTIIPGKDRILKCDKAIQYGNSTAIFNQISCRSGLIFSYGEVVGLNHASLNQDSTPGAGSGITAHGGVGEQKLTASEGNPSRSLIVRRSKRMVPRYGGASNNKLTIRK